MKATLRHIYLCRTANMSWRTSVVVKQIQSNPNCWRVALGLSSGGLHAAQLSHPLHSFSMVCWRPGQKKVKAILSLVSWTPMWPQVLCSWRCWNTSCSLSSGTRSWSLVLPFVSGYDLLNSRPPCICRCSHCVHKLLKESERCDMSLLGGWSDPTFFPGQQWADHWVVELAKSHVVHFPSTQPCSILHEASDRHEFLWWLRWQGSLCHHAMQIACSVDCLTPHDLLHLSLVL